MHATPEHGRFRRLRGRCLRLGPIVLPLIVLAAVALPHLDQGAFRTDTGWYAAIGLQGWRTGHLWTLMGEPGVAYFNKPPLGLWIYGLVLHGLGAGLVQARLPSVLAAAACVVLTARIARMLVGYRAALASGLVLALTYEFFRRTREISLDLWHLAFLLAAVWLVVAGARRDRPWLIALAGVPVGLALMTKPLLGLLALPILAAWLIWIGRTRLAVWIGAATAIALIVAGPWHVSMIALHGQDFTGQYFGAEVVGRAAVGPGEHSGGAAPPSFYVAQLGRTYWPWIVPLALALATWIRRRPLSPGSRGEKLALLWAGLWLVALTLFPDRRDRYALLILPALAWLGGMWLARWNPLDQLHRSMIRVGAPIAVLAAVIFALLPIRVQGGPDPQWRALFQWLDEHDRPQLWQGGFGGSKGARLYLHGLSWPRTTRDRSGRIIDSPPPGSLLIYHRREGLAQGPTETEIARFGDIWITRLETEPWRPVDAPDPGE